MSGVPAATAATSNRQGSIVKVAVPAVGAAVQRLTVAVAAVALVLSTGAMLAACEAQVPPEIAEVSRLTMIGVPTAAVAAPPTVIRWIRTVLVAEPPIWTNSPRVAQVLAATASR